MNNLRAIWYGSIIPLLYLIMMWLSLTVSVSLLVDDYLQGAGIVSAFSLFYIIRGYYFKEMYEAEKEEIGRRLANAKPNEEEG